MVWLPRNLPERGALRYLLHRGRERVIPGILNLPHPAGASRPGQPGANPQANTLNLRKNADHRPGVEYRRTTARDPTAAASCTRPGLTIPPPISPRSGSDDARPRRSHQRIRTRRVEAQVKTSGRVLEPRRVPSGGSEGVEGIRQGQATLVARAVGQREASQRYRDALPSLRACRRWSVPGLRSRRARSGRRARRDTDAPDAVRSRPVGGGMDMDSPHDLHSFSIRRAYGCIVLFWPLPQGSGQAGGRHSAQFRRCRSLCCHARSATTWATRHFMGTGIQSCCADRAPPGAASRTRRRSVRRPGG